MQQIDVNPARRDAPDASQPRSKIRQRPLPTKQNRRGALVVPPAGQAEHHKAVIVPKTTPAPPIRPSQALLPAPSITSVSTSRRNNIHRISRPCLPVESRAIGTSSSHLHLQCFVDILLVKYALVWRDVAYVLFM